MKSGELHQLTGLRFFAAIHVVLYHNLGLVGASIQNLPHWLLSINSAGESAVSFFFILSGFILTYVYTDENATIKTSYGKFLFARLSRIYPIYILAFLLDLPRGLSYFFQTYDQKAAFLKVGVSASAHLGMLQSWHPRLTPAWNFPAWSISTELFFYLVFPFLLPFIFRFKNDVLSLIVLWLTPVVIYFTFTIGLHYDLSEGAGAVFWRSFPALRVTEFLIGITIGKLFVQKHSKLYQWILNNQKICGRLFWISLCMSLALISIKLPIHKTLITNLLLVPFFSWMILVLATIKIPMSSIFEHQFIVLLGSASYAIYIIHIPILYYIRNLFQVMNFNPGFGYLSAYLLLLITASIILYKYFEVPVQKRLRKLLS